MNSIRTTWVGWGFLGLAGAGGYYVTKKSVSADRSARHQADMKREARELQAGVKVPPTATTEFEDRDKTLHADETGQGHTASPSVEASQDPAPSDQSLEEPEQRPRMKSKYEAQVPFTHNKGNRFSR